MKRSLLSITFTFALAAFALNACSSGGGGGSGSADNGPTVNAKQAYAWNLGLAGTFLPIVGTDGQTDYMVSYDVPKTGVTNPSGISDFDGDNLSRNTVNMPSTATDLRFRLINKVLYLGYKDGGTDHVLQYQGKNAQGDGVWQPVGNAADNTLPNLNAVAAPNSFYTTAKKSTVVAITATNTDQTKDIDLPTSFRVNSKVVLGPQNSNPVVVGSKVLMLGYMFLVSGEQPAIAEAVAGERYFKLAHEIKIDATSLDKYSVQALAYGNGIYLAGLQDPSNKKAIFAKSTDLQKWEKVKSIDASGSETLTIKAIVFQNQRFSLLTERSVPENSLTSHSCMVSISYDLQFFDELNKNNNGACSLITNYGGTYRLYTGNNRNRNSGDLSNFYEVNYFEGTPK